MKLKNFEDFKCVYGYVSLCKECAIKRENQGEDTMEVEEYWPAEECEWCKKKGELTRCGESW